MLWLSLLQSSSAQALFDGDLEQINPKTKLPVGWGFNQLNTLHYAFKLDSATVQQGKYSVSIASLNADGQFGGVGTYIPGSFEGKVIQLKGFIKTENVAVTPGYI